MQVKVTKAFTGRPDDEPLAREIAAGETVSGELAAYALANKFGTRRTLSSRSSKGSRNRSDFAALDNKPAATGKGKK